MSSNDMIQTITHSKSGASCQVHAFGATVLSFKSSDGQENLFVSRQAKLDGSKAIRGGIPLCFPIFGPPQEPGSTMPQHGFARNNMWTVKPGSRYDHDEVAGIAYTLDLADVSAESRGTNNPWSVQQATLDGTNCRLVYEITLGPKSLATTLIVENNGTDAFNFNMLQHTYLKAHNKAAHNKDQCHIHGLGGYNIIDKVHQEKSGVAQSYDYDADVVLEPAEETTDRVFIHPEEHPTVNLTVVCGNNRKLTMDAAGMVDESPVPVSCVVWNPGKAKASAMSDMADDEYSDMICVEPGVIGHQPLLNPGKEARMTQNIIVE